VADLQLALLGCVPLVRLEEPLRGLLLRARLARQTLRLEQSAVLLQRHVRGQQRALQFLVLARHWDGEVVWKGISLNTIIKQATIVHSSR